MQVPAISHRAGARDGGTVTLRAVKQRSTCGIPSALYMKFLRIRAASTCNGEGAGGWRCPLLKARAHKQNSRIPPLNGHSACDPTRSPQALLVLPGSGHPSAIWHRPIGEADVGAG